MEPEDIDQIIKEWLDEWKGSVVGDSDSEEDKDKEKDKGKGKEKVGEKQKAPQEEQPWLKKVKTKAQKPPSDVHLGLDDYEFIAN